MPLLRISKKLFTELSENGMINDVISLFNKFEYLGSTDKYNTPPNVHTYLVSADGLEPGEYFIDVLVTSHLQRDNSLKYTYSIQKQQI